MKKQCALCRDEFDCGNDNGAAGCWCTSLPRIMPLGVEHDCECPACLARSIGERIAALIERTPVQQMVAMAAPYRDGSLVEHIDYELENGNMVFSKWFHIKRGVCCGNGCRHCPYDHVNVGRT